MTEEECVRKLPVLATWSPEARTQFVDGMNELNGMAISGPPGEALDAIGVLILGPGGPWAHYSTRASVLEMAESEGDFPPEALAELRKPPPPEELRVLIVGLGKNLRMLLSIPGKMIRVSEPGSEEN